MPHIPYADNDAGRAARDLGFLPPRTTAEANNQREAIINYTEGRMDDIQAEAVRLYAEYLDGFDPERLPGTETAKEIDIQLGLTGNPATWDTRHGYSYTEHRLLFADPCGDGFGEIVVFEQFQKIAIVLGFGPEGMEVVYKRALNE